MKQLLFAVATISLLASCGDSEISTIELKTQEDSVNYAIGVLMSDNLKSDKNLKEVVSADLIYAAMKDALNGDSSEVFTLEKANEIVVNYTTSKAETAGQKYLEENAKKEGVKTTASGLQYEVLQAGTGAVPTRESVVRVHYHGTFTDGKVFDSSVQRGQPAEFPVTGVIPGWTEALQLMPVGSKWKLTLPHNIAYGPRGNRGIPPYSTLVFEVELLEILEAPTANPALGQ